MKNYYRKWEAKQSNYKKNKKEEEFWEPAKIDSSFVTSKKKTTIKQHQTRKYIKENMVTLRYQNISLHLMVLVRYGTSRQTIYLEPKRIKSSRKEVKYNI